MVNNKGIVAAIVLIIILATAGIYLAAQNIGPDNNTSNVSNNTPQNASQQNNTTNNETNSTNSTNSTNNTSTNNTNTTVSAQQAQKIAQVYILESGAEAGIPTINTWTDGRLVWNVPIINSKGEKEGVSIYIDAQTGARLG
jgi:hypothetical protein